MAQALSLRHGRACEYLVIYEMLIFGGDREGSRPLEGIREDIARLH